MFVEVPLGKLKILCRAHMGIVTQLQLHTRPLRHAQTVSDVRHHRWQQYTVIGLISQQVDLVQNIRTRKSKGHKKASKLQQTGQMSGLQN